MLKIVVGCYEQMLLGYEVIRNNDGKLNLQVDFTDHSHTGCVKAVATANKYLASGATDEIIYLFNLKKKTEEGALYAHEGSITKLAFADDHILLTAGEDGNICVFDATKNWDKLKVLKGHKAAVTDFSVHPSGKLALSVSKDTTLRTWNLINGRVAFVKNMKQFKPEFVEWDPSGEYYVLSSLSEMRVYELSSAEVITEIKFDRPILSMKFVAKDIISVAGEEGNIQIYNILEGGDPLLTIKAHESRIKALNVVKPPSEFAKSETDVWVISGSSNGQIKIFEIDTESMSYECATTFETTARITCLTCIQHT